MDRFDKCFEGAISNFYNALRLLEFFHDMDSNIFLLEKHYSEMFLEDSKNVQDHEAFCYYTFALFEFVRDIKEKSLVVMPGFTFETRSEAGVIENKTNKKMYVHSLVPFIYYQEI